MSSAACFAHGVTNRTGAGFRVDNATGPESV